MKAPDLRIPRVRAWVRAATEAERECDLPSGSIQGRRRTDDVVIARHAVWMALHRCGWSMAEIGYRSGRHHTSVMHALRTFPRRERHLPDGLVGRLMDIARAEP